MNFISAVELFENQAVRNPNKTAVVSSVRKYSYKQLNERANAVANSLIYMGVEPEERVMIYLPRVIENYAANLGILKAGGAFVNASVLYPYDRVMSIYKQASCRYVITNKDTLNQNAELFRKMKTVPLLIEQLMAERNKSNPNLEIPENNLCYVIFTSGSTGQPKGVMIEHGNLSNFLENDPQNTETYMICKNGTSMLAMAQFTFDMSVMEEFIALTSGMTLVLAEDSEILDADRINGLLTDNSVDALVVTPAYLNMLIDIPQLKDAISRVKVMDFGAEAFPPALFDRIRKVNPDVIILNGYGPTETTISCTVKELKSGEDVTIGYPNGNVYAYIVDENLNELPYGEEGEILICGKGVGRGYMNLPEETGKAFVTFRGMKAYHTGDFGIMRQDGDIEYRGRRDSQVKLRGLRIELGEIESVAGSHPAVKHCAAVVYDEKMLVLYYSSEENLEGDELKKYIKDKLALYMIPDKIVRLDELPMTDNLKIDKKALKKPETSSSNLIPPSNETERKLLDICRELCPDVPESIDANIITEGISSLGLMRLIAAIESEFSVRAGIGDIFNNPTVSDMEKFIDNSAVKEVFRLKDKYPVSNNQIEEFEYHKKRPEDLCWNLNYYYEMPLTIDPDKLAKSITGALVIHPELLSTFKEEDGTLWQIPADDELIFIPEIKHISDKQWEEMLPSLGKAFDCTGGELLLEIVIYVTESKVILYVDFSHMIIDGDSLDIFIRDMTLLYEKKQVEPEEMSAFELMLEEEKQIKTLYNDCRDYYETLIDRKAVIRSVSKRPDFGAVNPFIMKPLRTGMADLKKIGEKYKASNNVTASAAFGYVLAKEEGLKDSIFTVSYDNRYDSSLVNTAGYLCRKLPMYCHFEEGMDISAYFETAKEQIRRNLIYPATAEKYMTDVRPEYGDNLVIFQSEMSDDFNIDGITAKGSMVMHPVEVASMKIVLQLFPMGEMLFAVLVLDSSLYDEAFGNGFLDNIDAAFDKFLNGGEF